MRDRKKPPFTTSDAESVLTRRRWLRDGCAAAAACCLPEAVMGEEKAPAKTDPPAKKDPYADGVLVDGEPPLPRDGAFTFAVLPDTQHYSEKYPATYVAQTRWLVEQKERRRIAGVVHLGDITNHSTPAEWENARAAMKVLEDGALPYCMVPGNHDYSRNGGCSDRTTLLNDYFRIADLRKFPHWGGTYDRDPDRLENNFQLFDAAGRKFLALGLEFGPRADVIRWANDVVSRHRDCEVILVTHAFVYHDDARYDWAKFGDKQNWNPHSYGVAKATMDDVHDGEELWRKLVSRHENFILTLNGHVLEDGLGRLVTKSPGGREIPQILVNYQMRPKGGDGWLRLLELRNDGSMQTWDFSPTRNQRNESPQNQFAVKLPPIAPTA
jgi:hypothetical protein